MPAVRADGTIGVDCDHNLSMDEQRAKAIASRAGDGSAVGQAVSAADAAAIATAAVAKQVAAEVGAAVADALAPITAAIKAAGAPPASSSSGSA